MNKIKKLLLFGFFIALTVSFNRIDEIFALGASQKTLDYTFEEEDTIILYSTSIDTDNKNLSMKFEKVKHIKIDIPESTIDLDYLACFPNAISLSIPENITSISFLDTNSLPKLKEFIIDDKNQAYSSIHGVLYNKSMDTLVFYPHNGEKDAVVENGTKIIGRGAFNDSPINSVTFPEGIILIGSYSFANTNLTEISLPASFRTFDYNAFENTPLTKVIISEENKSLTSIDGVVYRKDRSFLYYWPEEKIVESLILPKELTYLNCSMIKHFNKVKQITIPDALTAILGTAENQIEQIYIDKQHPYLKIYDGVLYSSNYKNLMLYPNQNKDTDITIHSNLEVFPMDLFYTENTTRVLKLPKNLRRFNGSRKLLLGGFVNLSNLKIDRNNKSFVIENGVLYNYEKTHIVWYPIDLLGKEFKIPDTVLEIDNDQLIKQNHLEKLVVPDNCNLYYVDSNLEYGKYTIPTGSSCPKLKEFIVSKENPYYTTVEGVLFSKDRSRLLVYPSGKTDKVYQIPDTVKIVAFGNENHYLQIIKIPRNLSMFGYVAYTDVENNIYGDALLYYSALKKIEVDVSNQYYTSIDGVLYTNYDTKSLIAYPIGKTDQSFFLPKDVYEIYDVRNFNCNLYLKNIYIESSSQYQQLKDEELWLKKWVYNEWMSIHLEHITIHTY